MFQVAILSVMAQSMSIGPGVSGKAPSSCFLFLAVDLHDKELGINR